MAMQFSWAESSAMDGESEVKGGDFTTYENLYGNELQLFESFFNGNLNELDYLSDLSLPAGSESHISAEPIDLPFVKNELTENANPLKLREYLAAGLPVVSTDIPEAKAVAERGVYLADGADAFVTRVGEALSGGAGPNRARSDAMARESWDDKVADIETLLMELKP